jgi:hypothetical protein
MNWLAPLHFAPATKKPADPTRRDYFREYHARNRKRRRAYLTKKAREYRGIA